MVYLLYGEERYLIKGKIEELLFEKKAEKADVITFDGQDKAFNIFDVITEANTVSFFAEHKFILVENSLFLTGSKGLSEDEQVSIENYLVDPYQATTLIFTLDKDSLDNRKKITKVFNKYALVEKYPFLSPAAMRDLIIKDLSNNKLTIEHQALERLLEKMPCDLTKWKQELEKLITYGDVLTVDVINKLVTTDVFEDIFDLTSAVLSKDSFATMKILKDLKQLNYDEVAIILILASQFRFLYQVLFLDQKGFNQASIAKRLVAHPYRVSQSLKYKNKLSVKNLLSYLNKLSILDQNIKTGNYEKEISLTMFLLNPDNKMLKEKWS